MANDLNPADQTTSAKPSVKTDDRTGGRQVTVAEGQALNCESTLLYKEEADRQRDRFRLLLRITNALVSKLNLPELLRTVSTIMREVVLQEYVCLLLYDEVHRQVRLLALDSPQTIPGSCQEVMSSMLRIHLVDLPSKPNGRWWFSALPSCSGSVTTSSACW